LGELCHSRCNLSAGHNTRSLRNSPQDACSTRSAISGDTRTSPRASRLTVASETPSISAARRWVLAHLQKSWKLLMGPILAYPARVCKRLVADCAILRMARRKAGLDHCGGTLKVSPHETPLP